MMGPVEIGRMHVADELEDFYRRYNRCCNEHRFDELGDFVASDVRVNDATQGLGDYVSGLKAVVRAFPGYRWDLRHLLDSLGTPFPPPRHADDLAGGDARIAGHGSLMQVASAAMSPQRPASVTGVAGGCRCGLRRGPRGDRSGLSEIRR
jgi:hypothetical protein